MAASRRAGVSSGTPSTKTSEQPFSARARQSSALSGSPGAAPSAAPPGDAPWSPPPPPRACPGTRRSEGRQRSITAGEATASTAPRHVAGRWAHRAGAPSGWAAYQGAAASAAPGARRRTCCATGPCHHCPARGRRPPWRLAAVLFVQSPGGRLGSGPTMHGPPRVKVSRWSAGLKALPDRRGGRYRYRGRASSARSGCQTLTPGGNELQQKSTAEVRVKSLPRDCRRLSLRGPPACRSRPQEKEKRRGPSKGKPRR